MESCIAFHLIANHHGISLEETTEELARPTIVVALLAAVGTERARLAVERTAMLATLPTFGLRRSYRLSLAIAWLERFRIGVCAHAVAERCYGLSKSPTYTQMLSFSVREFSNEHLHTHGHLL